MPNNYFNLNDPFEKQVSERIDEYLHRGLPHDVVLDMIGRDFPCMDSEMRDHCENTVFIHHYTGEELYMILLQCLEKQKTRISNKIGF